MKTSRLFFAFVFVLLLSPSLAIGQQTEIILNVDIEEIQNVDAWQACWFDGQNRGQDPRDFLTENVRLGEVITWKGQAWNGQTRNNDTIIYIRRIKIKKGPNIFNSRSIDAIRNPGNQPPNRDVKGIVYHPTERSENSSRYFDYEYEISFTINDFRGKVTVYTIDPLIRTNVQTDIR